MDDEQTQEEMLPIEKLEDVIQKHRLPKYNPKIDWGPDFDNKADDEKIAYLKKFADSFNNALDMMQKERNQWREKAQKHERELIHMKKIVNQQRAMIQKVTQNENETKAAYQKRITALEDKIREIQ